MRIGELAHHAGVSPKAIRYYESIGVMPRPDRLDNGYRNYSESDVALLEFIGDAKAAGLALDEIRHVFELKGRGQSSCDHVVSMVQRRLNEVSNRIRQLRATQGELRRVLDRASRLDPGECNDPNRCQTIEVGRPRVKPRRAP